MGKAKVENIFRIQLQALLYKRAWLAKTYVDRDRLVELLAEALDEQSIQEVIDGSVVLQPAKKAVEDLDREILDVMKQGSTYEVEHAELGMRMKKASGSNSFIVKDLVVKTLGELEWDPDQIKWFLEQVTKETPYDYVDMRQIKAKDED